jgi:hypothetical protein
MTARDCPIPPLLPSFLSLRVGEKGPALRVEDVSRLVCYEQV